MTIPAFEAEDGYPTDEWLDAFIAYDPTHGECVCILVDLLPKWAALIRYCRCTVEDRERDISGPEKVVTFTTGGWSGAESLIKAVIAKPLIRAFFYSKWERSGLHEFRVPASQLAGRG